MTTTPKPPSEREKMRRVPGIVFADGPAGRRARIAGTGIGVFEVIKEYLADERDRTLLALDFSWLTPAQLDAALAYYATLPQEIDERLGEEDALTPEAIRRLYPWPNRERRSG